MQINTWYILAIFTCAFVSVLFITNKYRARLLSKISNLYFDPFEKMVVNVINVLNKHLEMEQGHYSIPWVLVIDAGDTGKTHLLNGHESVFLAEEDGEVLCSIHIHSDAVLIKADSKLSINPNSRYKKHWNSLVTALIRHRPGLSINSVVLMWPCNRLSEEYFGTSSKIGGQLSELQRKVGFKLPVYFVVSQCQVLPGFQQIAEALPAEIHKDVIGWSAPDLHYIDLSWIKEATGHIQDAIQKLSDAALVLARTPINTLVHINQSADVLAQGLVVTMHNVFRPNPGVIVPFVRGVYLCSLSGKDMLFCEKLFKRKIFVERGLVHSIDEQEDSPMYKARRVAEYLGISIPIAATLGMIRASTSLKESCVLLRGHVVQLEKCNTSHTAYNPYIMQKVLSTLNAAQRLDLVYVTIPSSWHSLLGQRLSGLYEQIHRKVVRSVLSVARAQMQELMSADVDFDMPDGGYERIEDTPVFARMRQVVNKINATEKALVDIASGTPEGYRSGISHFFPALKLLTVDTPRPILSEQLHNSSYLVSQAIDAKVANDIWDNLVHKFTSKILDPDGPKSLHLLVDKLRAFENPNDLFKTRQDLQELAAALSTLIAEVDSGQLEWICKDKLFAQHQLHELITLVSYSSTLGKQAVQRFMERCYERIYDVRKEMVYSVCLAAQSIFAKIDNSKEIQVSSKLRQLLGCLNFVLSQDFMQASVDNLRPSQSYSLIWDSTALQHLSTLTKQHATFQAEKSDTLRQLSKQNKEIIKRIADTEIIRCVERGLENTQLQAPEHRANNIKSFADIAHSLKVNGKYIVDAINHIYPINVLEVSKIVDKLSSSIEGFLVDLKQFLESGYAYDVASLVECAFDELRRDGLNNRLTLARSRLIYIVTNLAEPAIALYRKLHDLFPDRAHHEATIFWMQLIDEVQHYTENQSGGIADLEKMIIGLAQHKVTKVSLSDLTSYIGKSMILADKRSRDKMQKIYTQEYIRHYQPVADYFNQHLAGRFPFAFDKNAPFAKEAELLEFYKLYRSVSKKLQELSSNQLIPGKLKADTAQFLRSIECSEYWLGFARMKTHIRLDPKVSRNNSLNKHIAQWTLYCDAEQFTPQWKDVMINWSQYRSFGIQLDLANLSKIKFANGTKRFVMRADKWEWLRYITAQAPYTRTREGGILHLIIPTTHGVMQVDMILGFYDVNGEIIGWPQFTTQAPKVEGLYV